MTDMGRHPLASRAAVQGRTPDHAVDARGDREPATGPPVRRAAGPGIAPAVPGNRRRLDPRARTATRRAPAGTVLTGRPSALRWFTTRLRRSSVVRARRCEPFVDRRAGGGVRAGATHGRTDGFGFHIIEGAVHAQDLQATVLHLLGFDHARSTYRSAGRDDRLTDVHGRAVPELVARARAKSPTDRHRDAARSEVVGHDVAPAIAVDVSHLWRPEAALMSSGGTEHARDPVVSG
ncbi:MAG: DUF1501 domain-containing protein [Planctomycetes bacterium]|nr:DUF1501 domain-containing protein [Planctomycetota bacterium]